MNDTALTSRSTPPLRGAGGVRFFTGMMEAE